MRACTLSALLFCLAWPSWADVLVRFDEGAPKDRFTISNVGGCALGPMAITIDLRGSPYGLIFDVTGQGAGVQVFQPFDVSTGGENLKAVPKILDGDAQVTLDLIGLPASASLSFTIDVDDTASSRETTVADNEILGAQVIAQAGATTATAPFNEDATAKVPLSSCVS